MSTTATRTNAVLATLPPREQCYDPEFYRVRRFIAVRRSIDEYQHLAIPLRIAGLLSGTDVSEANGFAFRIAGPAHDFSRGHSTRRRPNRESYFGGSFGCGCSLGPSSI